MDYKLSWALAAGELVCFIELRYIELLILEISMNKGLHTRIGVLPLLY